MISTLGRYKIVSEIGQGAMGVVYAAYDPELDRKVALKLVRSEARGSKARARLVREAQAMARLSHPNVVTVYDVTTAGDEVVLALELVDGTTLREALEPRDAERGNAFGEFDGGFSAWRNGQCLFGQRQRAQLASTARAKRCGGAVECDFVSRDDLGSEYLVNLLD